MPCPCCGGACCYPEMEACTELGDPCGGEGDPACPEGFTCVGGICERLSVTPIGTCPGTVSGPVAASCVDGLTRSACESQGGTFHSGKTCAQDACIGACCDGFGCYESTEWECYGAWQGPATTCDPSPCEYPGACCIDGVCSEVNSEAECTAAGGVYQGLNSTCEDGDCADGCCGDNVCPPWGAKCRPGYFASTCAGVGGLTCDPSEGAPQETGVYSCASAVTTATVTASGHVVGTPGSQSALELEAEAAMNDTYAVHLNCSGNGSATFAVGNFNVTVGVGVTSQLTAYIDVRLASTNQRFCASNAPSQFFTFNPYTACGDIIYDCQGVTGSAVFGVTSFCGGAGASYTVTLS